MRVIVYNKNKEAEEESYVCFPGQPIESFQISKIFLWAEEATDQTIQKKYPEKTWEEYRSYLLSRFPEGEPIIIKIKDKNKDT
jgi:hypothetical protein